MYVHKRYLIITANHRRHGMMPEILQPEPEKVNCNLLLVRVSVCVCVCQGAVFHNLSCYIFVNVIGCFSSISSFHITLVSNRQ